MVERNAKYSSVLNEFESRLIMLKRDQGMRIFEKLSLDNQVIDIDENLKILVEENYDSEFSKSLYKFFKTFVGQTGNYSLEVDYFIFNLISAANRRKFGLREFIFT